MNFKSVRPLDINALSRVIGGGAYDEQDIGEGGGPGTIDRQGSPERDYKNKCVICINTCK